MPGTSVGQPLARHAVNAAQTARNPRAVLPPVTAVSVRNGAGETVKGSFNADRTARQLATEREAEKAESRWKSDVEAAVIANPNLEGKEREFAEYANKPTHKGAPMQTLVDAFLYKSGQAPTPAPRQPGLEPGNGGPKGPEKPKLLAPEALKTLRETDPAAYRTYVATHDLSQLDV